MTLVEAHLHAKKDQFDIVCDTRVSWSGEPPGHEGRSLHLSLDHAVLKLIISKSRTRCLCFAGEVDPDGMQDVLVPFYEEAETLDDEVSRLADVARQRSSDFIVAACDPAGLWKIRHEPRPVDRGLFAWIGEPSAHEEFRSSFDLARKPRFYERMESAMQEVVDSGAVRSVGGMVVRVSTATDGRFSYFPLSGQHIGDADARGLRPGGVEAVSISNGGFMWSALTCTDNYPAVGWWFPQSGHGFLSDPLTATAPRAFEAEDRNGAVVAAGALTDRPMLIDRTVRVRAILG